MQYLESDIMLAHEIVLTLTQNKTINGFKRDDLYKTYLTNSNVQQLVEKICELQGLHIIDKFENGLFITPGISNKLFGYSNEELRKILKANNNDELYTHYFIIYIVMTMFYKETIGVPCRQYVTSSDVVNRVDSVLSSVKGNDKEGCSLSSIKKYWTNLAEISPSAKGDNVEQCSIGSNKYAVVNRSLIFGSSQDMFIYNENEKTYEVTERFKALIGHYFSRKDVKNELVDMLDNLIEIDNIDN